MCTSEPAVVLRLDLGDLVRQKGEPHKSGKYRPNLPAQNIININPRSVSLLVGAEWNFNLTHYQNGMSVILTQQNEPGRRGFLLRNIITHAYNSPCI